MVALNGPLLGREKRRVRTAFARAAGSYDQVTVLQQEVGRRVRERLCMVRVRPHAVLDLGAGTGIGTAALVRQFRQAAVTAVDVAVPMLIHARRRTPWFRRMGLVGGDAESLPLVDASFDLVHSNLMLQWCSALERALEEMLRVLRPGGLLVFSTFGPDTLRELRKSWRAVDHQAHVNQFVDMHDIGDLLLRCGFADPVVDAETFTLTYEDPQGVMRDLKRMGANTVTSGRGRAMTGKGRFRAMLAEYEKRRQGDRLPATFEVLYGLAWAPRPAAGRVGPRPTTRSVTVPLDGLGAGWRGR